MSTLIIDYGMSNLGSVRRAFEECGAPVEVSADPASLARASHAVLPGVGSFAAAMDQLQRLGWVETIVGSVATGRVLLLGICLGMQLLAERGQEGGPVAGLGFIPGEVVRLPDSPGFRIPHTGWNEVHTRRPSPLLAGLPDGTDFYFVHSYAFVPAREGDVVARTPYGDWFVSVVARGNVYGTQFHPEKSQDSGFRLIRNFLALGPTG